MPGNDADSVNRRVATALEYIYSDADALRPYLEWHYRELMTPLKMCDMTSEELAAMIAVLVPAYARKVSSPAGQLCGSLGEVPGWSQRLRLIRPAAGD